MAAQGVVVAVLLANALWLGSSSLYVVGVLYGLGIAFLVFVVGGDTVRILREALPSRAVRHDLGRRSP